VVWEFGFAVSTAIVTVTVVVIGIVAVVGVLALVPASLQSSVYKPPAFVSDRLGAKR
jgi:uncharacterized membrane protein